MSGPGDFTMRREMLDEVGGVPVLALNTIAHLREEDASKLIVSGSRGGISSDEFGGALALWCVFFSDALVGKDAAGTAALPLDARGIATGCISHETAVIGAALETWSPGVISALNKRAQAAGLRVGEPLRAGSGPIQLNTTRESNNDDHEDTNRQRPRACHRLGSGRRGAGDRD